MRVNLIAAAAVAAGAGQHGRRLAVQRIRRHPVRRRPGGERWLMAVQRTFCRFRRRHRSDGGRSRRGNPWPTHTKRSESIV